MNLIIHAKFTSGDDVVYLVRFIKGGVESVLRIGSAHNNIETLVYIQTRA